MVNSESMATIPNFDACVSQAVKTLLAFEHSTRETSSAKKNLITDENEKIFLTLQLKKIPFLKLGYTKVSKIPLKHPIYDATTSVCLFVKDVEKKPDDDEPSIRHFKQLLESNNVSQFVHEIIPLHMMRTEFKPYEQKRNLCHSHELFLADDRVAGVLHGIIGKEFWKSKKLPVKINLQSQNLAKEFEKVLNQTYYYTNGKGSLSSVHVANSSQSEAEIVENVKSVISHLCKAVPSGVENIRGIHLRKNLSVAIPVFISLGSPNDVKVETEERKLEEEDVEAEELSTKLNTKVKVFASGRVQVIKDKSKADGLDDSSEGEEDDFQELITKKRKGFRLKKPSKRRLTSIKKQKKV